MEDKKKKDETILVTKDMVARVKIAIENVDYQSDEYFYLDDFLRVCQGATEIYISIDHFKHIAWVFCIELTGRLECEIFGSDQFDCPLNPLFSDKPVCPIYQG